MSRIAQALATAKERTGHSTAPFVVPGALPSTEETERLRMIRQLAVKRQRFWITVAVVVLILVGVVLWMQFKGSAAPASPEQNPQTTRSTPPSSSSPIVGKAVPSIAAADSKSANYAAYPKPLGANPASGPASSPAVAPSAELTRLVASLAISAVMPGDPPRIMVAGCVVRVGESIEGAVTFVGLQDGRVQFIDSRGAIYARSY